MKFKVLKSKEASGMYGVIDATHNLFDIDNPGTNVQDTAEILHCETPQLFGKDACKSDLIEMLWATEAQAQLDDYDLVLVELTEIG